MLNIAVAVLMTLAFLGTLYDLLKPWRDKRFEARWKRKRGL
jgi:hypothetical protein